MRPLRTGKNTCGPDSLPRPVRIRAGTHTWRGACPNALAIHPMQYLRKDTVMSRETIEWLNQNTLIGFTDKRGAAWHGRKGDDNHYVGAVPVDDVRKRLFNWTAEERDVYVANYAADEYTIPTTSKATGRKAIVRSDTGAVLGIFTTSFEIHDYEQWLLSNVEHLLGDELQIGTAGLLRGGGQAWVQVEVPETVSGPGGTSFRPFLLAATSLDGSLSSSYGRAVTNTVCDNTMAIAMSEGGRMKFRHRKGASLQGKIATVREALDIVYTAADDFGRQVEALLETEFTNRQFEALVQDEVPLPKDPKKAPAAYNAAQAKRNHLLDMYRFDARVSDWTGTAYGAWQAFNTFDQHESKIRKTTNRVERNAGLMVTGRQEKADAAILVKILELAS